MSDFKLENFYN